VTTGEASFDSLPGPKIQRVETMVAEPA